VTIFFGAILGGILKLFGRTLDDVYKLESKFFFLILLPPIIYDSGYNMRKGHFFHNIGSILIFAVFGTIISAIVIGVFLWMFRLLPLLDAMIYGSLLSAVDPVATLAIFQALDVDPTLDALVFGESILNDAVSIVLFKTFIEFKSEFSVYMIWGSTQRFFIIFFGSCVIGILGALVTALVFKHTNFKKNPSLEISLMFISSYAPYLIAESLELSGILAILFCGIINSEYTHYNLSPFSQITEQQTFHMLAYVAENVLFIYLGLAIFSFPHQFDFWLIIATILLCLVSRAANVYPLSYLINPYREIKISPKFQFVIWFSGLRGAIAFSLSLSIPGPYRQVLVTTTLMVVLFTIIFLGGGTLPLLKLLNVQKTVIISKTANMTTHDEDKEVIPIDEPSHRIGWFEKFNLEYAKPFFTRKTKRVTIENHQIELEEVDH
jgi:sodium/hydrogen exchanger 8